MTFTFKASDAPAVIRILAAVLKAYAEIDDPGMSDLDNEQPVALNLHIVLGDIRRIRTLGVLK